MKRTLTLILAALMALTAIVVVPVGADENITSGDWEYTVNEDGTTATIAKYNGSAPELEIPAQIDGYKITVLGERAFQGCTAQSVTIPNTVITIGSWTFESCKATTIIIPDSVEVIGYAAFECTKFKTITIPDSVMSIDSWAFTKNSLESITIPDSVTYLGSLAFCDCRSLESVTLGSGIKSINDHTFEKLTNITIPAGVTSIGSSSFAGCASLTGIEVDENNTEYKSVDGVLYTKDGKTLVVCPGTKTNVTIPESVTTIAGNAFEQCNSLVSVTIPNGVEKIGAYAFEMCFSLTSVTIPASVEKIGDCVFFGCSSLKNVCYAGSKEQWNNIEISTDRNANLLKANVVFNHPAHDFTAAVSDPTCTKAGFTTYTCELCGDSYTADDVPVLGHDFADGVCVRCGVHIGDLNADGKINSRDVIAIMKLILTPDPEITPLNDLNDDGKLNSRDVIALMRLVLSQS